jgi:hypothetical protein
VSGRHCLRQTQSVCARERKRRSNPLLLVVAMEPIPRLCSPPPCGEGSGVGVHTGRLAWGYPPPQPSPTRGEGELCGTDLPVASSPLSKKISLFDLVETAIEPSRPVPQRGGSRSSRNAGRDAVDADGAFDEWRRRGRRSRVVLTPRRWCQASRIKIRKATVARKPGHRGEYEGNR